jgi:tRNA A-37 threonylcarbamoyl transferase component Bud32
MGVAVQLAQLLEKVYAAAQLVQSNRAASSRLSSRFKASQAALIQSATKSPTVAAAADALLSEVLAYLQKLNIKEPLLLFEAHANTVSTFKRFNEELLRLIGEVSALSVQQQKAENLQDARSDFDLAQAINRQTLSADAAKLANKQLQLRASAVGFTGFVEVDFDTLELGRSLGEGSFGSVYRSQWCDMLVAVKEANSRALDATIIKLLRNELRVHASAEALHERIVQFHGACTVHPDFALVMEYAPFGSLYDLLHSDDGNQHQLQLTLQVRIQMLTDVAVAVSHLRNHSIVHGDIKTSNVLVFKDNRAKLCDFGLATVYSSVRASSRQRDPQLCGTPGYMAPEILEGETAITFSSDVYSYSMVMYEMITNRLPYSGMQQRVIDMQVLLGLRPAVADDSIVVGCSVFKPLMEQCWQRIPQERPDFNTIVNSISCIATETCAAVEVEGECTELLTIQGTLVHEFKLASLVITGAYI